MKLEEFIFKTDLRYVKVHGLQRSGTNYLTYLIDKNLNAKTLVNAGGWKHGPWCAPWVLGEEVDTIVVVKNPYSWLVSVFNYWKDNTIGMDLSSASFQDFVTSRAVFEEAPGVPSLFRASNPVQYWNNMNFHWASIQMNQKKMLVVAYEMAKSDPETALKFIADNFGLEVKSTNVPQNRLEAGEEVAIESDKPFDHDYDKEGKYFSYYTKELVEYVNRELDLDLMRHLGYNLVEV